LIRWRRKKRNLHSLRRRRKDPLGGSAPYKEAEEKVEEVTGKAQELIDSAKRTAEMADDRRRKMSKAREQLVPMKKQAEASGNQELIAVLGKAEKSLLEEEVGRAERKTLAQASGKPHTLQRWELSHQ
jgi:sugar-specific transcriptional regulator TrmB